MDEQSIFLAALEKDRSDERAAFVAQACGGDESLRQDVESLLQAHSKLGDGEFLQESPLNRERTLDQRGLDLVGTQIGPYKIREQIGEGGMGVVYVAQQTEPVRRKVALKVIKPGMSSKDVVRRFAAEQQSLALMNHPNIAQVFDGGATAAGQPYFVMELVQGLPITEYCDQQGLSTDQRLKLFATVCKAVQHAHQRGIIHRDLKPSNVIVAEIDAASVPKVIDFGVARAINQQLINQTVYTQFSQMVGTPLYMSPEQAGLGVIDIDTRSDVYSLGVLLYELLSGSTPFNSEVLRSAGFDEMRRIIREDDPPRPSAMVSTLYAEALSTVADRRRIDTRKLSSSLSGELDWLVMKALEKDRNRRYESASALAADIQRFLNGEAVLACPPSSLYRFRKSAGRHKAALATAAAITVVLIAGIVGTTWQMLRAIDAEQDAQAVATKAESEASIAKALNDFLHDDLLAQASPNNQPDPNITLLEVVDGAAKTIADRFADQPLVEAAIRHTLAKTYRDLGKYKEATKHANRALQLRLTHLGADNTETIQSGLLSARLLELQGNYAASRKRLGGLISRALTVLGPADPVTLKGQHYLASVLWRQGDYTAAEKIAQEVLKTKRRTLGDDHEDTCRSMMLLANVYNHQARYAEAEELHRQALEILRRTLGDEHPRTLWTMVNLATAYQNQSRYGEAEELYLKALEIDRRVLGDEHPQTLTVQQNLGAVFVHQGRLEEAEQATQKVLEIRLRILEKEHPQTLSVMGNLVHIYEQQEKWAEAGNLMEEIVACCRRTLGDEHPETLIYQGNLANIYREQRRFDESEELYHQVIERLRHRLSEEPSSASYTDKISGLAYLQDAKYNLARAFSQQNRHAEAEELLRQVLKETGRSKLGDGHHLTLNSKWFLASTVQKQHRYDEAATLWQELIQMAHGTWDETNRWMLSAKKHLAETYHHLERYEEQETLLRNNSAILIRTAGIEDSDAQESLLELGKCWTSLLKNARERGEADQLFGRANEFVERLLEAEHEPEQCLGACVGLYNAASLVKGETTAAEEKFRRTVEDRLAPALESARLAVQDDPKSKQRWDRWSALALAYYRTQNWVGAEVGARLAVELAADNPDILRQIAPLLLLAGKQDEYGALCERLLNDSEKWSGSNLACAVYICSLNPLAPANPEALLKLAKRAVDEGFGSKSRVDYRAGEYAKAIEGLMSVESPRLWHQFDLAIANHLAGHAEEARAWWEKAIRSLKDWDAANARERIRVEVLRQEAEHLIFGKEGPNKEHKEDAAIPVNDNPA